jgi:hypothetical protein
MDGELMRLARNYGCWYTRYADDLTFSSGHTEFPREIAEYSPSERTTTVGADLQRVVEDNGFRIQDGKTRLQSMPHRQMVTGVVVNDRLNLDRRFVRRIRAMLHSLEVLGAEGAQAKFEALDTKDRWPGARPRFLSVLAGKLSYLAMVRGQNDELVTRLKAQFENLVNGRPRLLGIPPARSVYPDSRTVTLVFTDIEHSSRLAEEVGDEIWATIVGWHDDLVREVVAAVGGDFVKPLGDGAMLAFRSARAAARAAVEIQRAFARPAPVFPLGVRV